MSVKIMNDGLRHYDINGLLGSPAPICMVIGGRTVGKTFSMLYTAMNTKIKTGADSVFLTRYDTEIIDINVEEQFGALHNAGMFTDYEIRGVGNECDIKIEGVWERLATYIPLNLYVRYKRKTNFVNTKYIFFDEFITEGRVSYLKNEPTILVNLWSSIARRRDVKVIMAANALSNVNPYFAEWGVHMPAPGKTKTFRHNDSFITVENCYDADFVDEMADNSVSKFMRGTAYEQMATYNRMIDDRYMYGDCPKNAISLYNIITSTYRSTMFMGTNGMLYATKFRKNNKTNIYVGTLREDGGVRVTRRDRIIRDIRSAIEHDKIIFDNAATAYAYESEIL